MSLVVCSRPDHSISSSIKTQDIEILVSDNQPKLDEVLHLYQHIDPEFFKIYKQKFSKRMSAEETQRQINLALKNANTKPFQKGFFSFELRQTETCNCYFFGFFVHDKQVGKTYNFPFDFPTPIGYPFRKNDTRRLWEFHRLLAAAKMFGIEVARQIRLTQIHAPHMFKDIRHEKRCGAVFQIRHRSPKYNQPLLKMDSAFPLIFPAAMMLCQCAYVFVVESCYFHWKTSGNGREDFAQVEEFDDKHRKDQVTALFNLANEKFCVFELNRAMQGLVRGRRHERI